MAYYDFLSVVFAPILKLPPALAVISISLIISLIIILVTKYATNQELMKKLKEEMKDHQKQVKELRNNPARALEVQKKMMSSNMEYMRLSFKATFFTIIPIFIIFGWMSSTFAFQSIHPNQEFTMTALFGKGALGTAAIEIPEGMQVIGNRTQKIENSVATWKLKGSEGQYTVEVVYDDEKQRRDVLITNTEKYLSQQKKTDGAIKSIQLGYKKRTILPIGYKDWLGWLGVYIWSSIAFTMILRKILKVH